VRGKTKEKDSFEEELDEDALKRQEELKLLETLLEANSKLVAVEKRIYKLKELRFTVKGLVDLAHREGNKEAQVFSGLGANSGLGGNDNQVIQLINTNMVKDHDPSVSANYDAFMHIGEETIRLADQESRDLIDVKGFLIDMLKTPDVEAAIEILTEKVGRVNENGMVDVKFGSGGRKSILAQSEEQLVEEKLEKAGKQIDFVRNNLITKADGVLISSKVAIAGLVSAQPVLEDLIRELEEEEKKIQAELILSNAKSRTEGRTASGNGRRVSESESVTQLFGNLNLNDNGDNANGWVDDPNNRESMYDHFESFVDLIPEVQEEHKENSNVQEEHKENSNNENSSNENTFNIIDDKNVNDTNNVNSNNDSTNVRSSSRMSGFMDAFTAKIPWSPKFNVPTNFGFGGNFIKAKKAKTPKASGGKPSKPVKLQEEKDLVQVLKDAVHKFGLVESLIERVKELRGSVKEVADIAFGPSRGGSSRSQSSRGIANEGSNNGGTNNGGNTNTNNNRIPSPSNINSIGSRKYKLQSQYSIISVLINDMGLKF